MKIGKLQSGAGRNTWDLRTGNRGPKDSKTCESIAMRTSSCVPTNVQLELGHGELNGSLTDHVALCLRNGAGCSVVRECFSWLVRHLLRTPPPALGRKPFSRPAMARTVWTSSIFRGVYRAGVSRKRNFFSSGEASAVARTLHCACHGIVRPIYDDSGV